MLIKYISVYTIVFNLYIAKFVKQTLSKFNNGWILIEHIFYFNNSFKINLISLYFLNNSLFINIKL
jgi:hypothetical protein